MKRKYYIAMTVGLLGLTLDQVAKTAARKALSPMHAIALVPGVLEFRYAENRGLILGLLSDLPPNLRLALFSLVSLAAAGIIIRLLGQVPDRSRLMPAALGSILAGAFGNLADRFRWGAVTDFIRVQLSPNYSWPTFNPADALLAIGIILLVLDALFGRREPESKGEEAPPPAPEEVAAN